MKERQDTEIDLLKLAKALWVKAWAIILAAVIGGGAAFVYSKFVIAPTYEASTLLYVNNSSISVGGASISISSAELSAAQSLVKTYLVILQTRRTLEEVITEAELPYTYEELSRMITAASVNSTEIFEVKVTSKSPEEAEKIANTIGQILPDKIADIVDGSSVRIVDYAVVPAEKAAPSVAKNTAMGLLLGAILCSAVIIMIFLLDDTLRASDDPTELYDLPLLATIPDLIETSSSKSGRRKSPSYGKKL